ncbi:MAG: IS5 family transposase [Candidatus Liptonbacteria bacterium]|nr:IS5 family transposase [Candidatus Liptonbacteria bacterium]
MRGREENQGYMFSYLSPEERVPQDHPLRRIKTMADEALGSLSRTFDRMYAKEGRPSIPPERLLKAQLLIALYTIRSERLFCEMLDYNILFRWFLGMSLEERSFDATTFTKNRDRLLQHDVAGRFLQAVVTRAQAAGLLSDEHFTVDGTLVEAWASLKSFRPTDAPDQGVDADDPGNVTVDFHGQTRTNQTHRSTTDPDARLARKGAGKEAKLSYGVSLLMENRHGLIVDVKVHDPTGTGEREAALALLQCQRRRRGCPRSVGADKGYHTKAFVEALWLQCITPHIAMVEGRRTPGLDGRTTRSIGYALSQRVRKRIEEGFGWLKTVGGLRRTRYRGAERVTLHTKLTVVAHMLLRMAKLCPQPIPT